MTQTECADFDLRGYRVLHLVSLAPLNDEGHDKFYTIGTAQAASRSGLRVRLSYPKKSSAESELSSVAKLNPLSLPVISDLESQHTFARLRHSVRVKQRKGQLEAALRRNSPDEVTFIHTCGFHDLTLLADMKQIGRGPLGILLRFDHYDDITAIQALKKISIFAEQRPLYFFTDSEDLAALFGPIMGLEITLIKPPVFFAEDACEHNIDPMELQQKHPDVLTFGYLGSARPSKGFHRLPQLVDAIMQASPNSRFLIQSYLHSHNRQREIIRKALQALRQKENVTMFSDSLSNEAYKKIIDQCDVILLPYDGFTYRHVTSGVFVEAVMAGKYVLMPERTWMAKETKRYNLPRCYSGAFDSHDWVSECIISINEDRQGPQVPPSTQRLDPRWVEQHYFKTLVKTLMTNVPSRSSLA